MGVSDFPDAFKDTRATKGVCPFNDQNDSVAMLLRFKDVRKSAHDYKSFISGAQPGRIVVPSEVNIRDTRQIPFEVDPPEHTEYRALVEDWFKRPLDAAYEAGLEAIIAAELDRVLVKGRIEAIAELSLPIQSRALTLLLNIPMKEAETWISWGTHVFRSEDSDLDGDKAAILYDYIDAEIDKLIANPDDSLYGVLLQSEYQGRKMTKEEVKGVLILTFAGGRDTIINYLTNTLAYLAEHPEAITELRDNPELLNTAIEELVRYFSPLTHMGRVVAQEKEVSGHVAKEDTRVSLCWASANRDEAIFENPNAVVLDRKMNPHVAFGFGTHKCLGATHARQLMKVFLRVFTQKVAKLTVVKAVENIEDWGEHQRKVGFDSLEIELNPIK
ncbi:MULTISPECIES: cytochrome P450 [Maribacter]|uniref:Cytochrome P450 n=1 Tax=Maribacter flavus TaxID=1658664 RepID=A0A5B2U026_9FLAO|nr:MULTISPECIES: cytochrome P450 [Maribacter]KAA2219678.1 cytochrome P450 [Maribacter flavus]MDC6407120.1 cytochrome P450 [Maribacter sp. PR66]MEE1971781.1 cytochrome P450 [Maribacter flavus]